LSLATTVLAIVTAVLAVVLAIVTAVLAIVLAIVTTVVVAAVVASIVALADSKPNAIVLGPTLSDRHDDRLMIAGGSHGTGTVIAGRKTSCKICAEQALAISSIVDALEEDKVLRVEGLRRVWVATQVLNSDVGVADDLPTLQCLRS
jgi:hypothetical protein